MRFYTGTIVLYYYIYKNIHYKLYICKSFFNKTLLNSIYYRFFFLIINNFISILKIYLQYISFISYSFQSNLDKIDIDFEFFFSKIF